MNFIHLKIKLLFIVLITSFCLHSQISISLIGKNSYEVKNTLGQNGYDLLYEDDDILIFEKKVEFSKNHQYLDPFFERFYISYCNDKSFLLNHDFIFLPDYTDDSKNYFNVVKKDIANTLDPKKPKKRKDRASWRPYPSSDTYNILTEDFLIRKTTIWEKFDNLKFSVSEGKQTGEYFGFKTNAGINIVRLSIYNEYLDDGCTDNPKYVNFFKKYFVKYIAPDDLNHYLYTYVDDLNSFGVFDHLNIEDNDWSEILSTFTNTIDIYFKDIRDFSNKPDYNSIAIARAMNDNCKLDIQVDYSNWNEATNVKRLWIMYHELTHDLFNVEHGHGGPMMNPKLPINMTEQNFLEARETLISYLKLIKFNKTCNQKGKEKLKELLKNNN